MHPFLFFPSPFPRPFSSNSPKNVDTTVTVPLNGLFNAQYGAIVPEDNSEKR